MAQGIRRNKPNAWYGAQPGGAVAELLSVDVGADRLLKQIVGHGDERAVTASVIEQRAAGACRCQLASQREATAMTPRNDGVAAEDLFAGIVPGFDQLFGWRVHRGNEKEVLPMARAGMSGN